MKHQFGILLLTASILAAAPGSAPKGGGVFPYAVEKITLDNGLDILLVEMPEFKDVLSFNMLVLAGARNETQKGKTGFAHLFEHLMFQHRYGGEAGGYADAINRLGAHNNAWTWFDITYYHPLTFTANLDNKTLPSGDTMTGLLELEASRFMALDFDEAIFKTATGAVMGEYRNNASNPGRAMAEEQLRLAFPRHSYGHTTIGYYDDVVAMPEQYEHARWFYDTYYRPNNCVLVVAGDIRKADILPKLEQAFASWEAKETPAIDLEDPPQTAENRGHVDWDAAVPPRISVAYKGPRFITGTKESAVMQILSELLTSRSAPLYQQLRFEKQSASSLFLSAPDSFDRYLIDLGARLFADKYSSGGAAYLEETEADMVQGFEDLKTFASSAGAAEVLETVKSKFKYDLLGQLNSPANVAQNLAWFYRFERDPQVIDKLVASIQQLTPQDIEAFAATYFVPENRTVVTLTPKGEE